MVHFFQLQFIWSLPQNVLPQQRYRNSSMSRHQVSLPIDAVLSLALSAVDFALPGLSGSFLCVEQGLRFSTNINPLFYLILYVYLSCVFNSSLGNILRVIKHIYINPNATFFSFNFFYEKITPKQSKQSSHLCDPI